MNFNHRSDFIDETNNVYGNLTVIKPEKDKNGRSAWLCQCTCGQYKIARGPDLRAGRIISCGCQKIKRCKESAKDITGQHFGELTAIKYEYSEHEKQYWSFRCNCGKIVVRNKGSVLNGNTTTCGCKTNILNSFYNRSEVIIGERFGLQEVIENLSPIGTFGKTKVLCKCIKCDRTKEYYLTDLRFNPNRSCPCCQSYKEYEISEILKNNGITFSQQYKFDDLRSKKNIMLRFDFAIFNQNQQLIGLIEYQGQQHYTSWGYDKSLNDLQERQERDQMKVDYCEKNNIPLLILNKDSSLLEEIIKFYKTFNE